MAPTPKNRSEPLPIGLVVDWSGSYGRGVLRGIMSYARSHPYWVVRATNWGGIQDANPGSWEVAGYILQTYQPKVQQMVADARRPTVSVSNFLYNQPFPVIVPDDAAVGRMAADYLLRRGFRHLAFYGLSTVEFSDLRQATYSKAVIAGGAQYHSKDDACPLATWVQGLPRPTGVFCCNDHCAHQMLQACAQVGVRVPDDLAVLGVDDDELLNAMGSPSLSSVVIPADRVGYEAAALLDRMLNGGGPAAGRCLRLQPLGVVTRDSTDIVAVDDEELAQVLRFIRTHASEPISVGDVLVAVPMSRRSLERLFRTRLRTTLLAEIQRAHVEKAKQILITSDTPLRNVARLSGFSCATRLGIVFAKVVGMPPSEYRRRYQVRHTSAPAKG